MQHILPVESHPRQMVERQRLPTATPSTCEAPPGWASSVASLKVAASRLKPGQSKVTFFVIKIYIVDDKGNNTRDFYATVITTMNVSGLG